jgi:leucine-rich repeat-containing protein 49
VLDLHSNKLTKIENISHLSELRVLNLANNLITHVEGLTGLVSLTEMNLRRNLIESVQGLNHCPRLQRIFLSNNRIEKFDNIQSIKDAHQLTELALDGNPVTNKEGYFQFCIKNCPTLKNLDMMKITQEMRDNNGVPTELDKQKAAAAQAEGLKAGDGTTTATDLSASEKHIGGSTTTAGAGGP